MQKPLLIWNSILTVILLVGLGTLSYYSTLMNQRISVLIQDNMNIREAISQHAVVINQQTEVINQQSQIINEDMNVMNEKYLEIIEENTAVMEEMSVLIDKYAEVINNDTIYFEELSESLKRLFIIIPQPE
jgi:ADP-glucose pyrophosphorylase